MTAITAILPEAFSAAVFLPGDASARRLALQIERIAPHFRIALLTGERGTGKLTVAHRMHALSPVAAGSLTVLDASVFADSANDASAHAAPGSLYLEGLDLVPLNRQPALLERLDAVSRHLRVLLASESELRGLLASGRLLQPLFERVGALSIRLSPLRERRESIALLASAMLESLNPGAWFNEPALARLKDHSWRGNLDELWQVVAQQAATAEGEITSAQIELAPAAPDPTPAIRLEDVVERHVIDVVQRCAGNKLRAAELLGISRSTLYRMLDAATHN